MCQSQTSSHRTEPSGRSFGAPGSKSSFALRVPDGSTGLSAVAVANTTPHSWSSPACWNTNATQWQRNWLVLLPPHQPASPHGASSNMSAQAMLPLRTCSPTSSWQSARCKHPSTNSIPLVLPVDCFTLCPFCLPPRSMTHSHSPLLFTDSEACALQAPCTCHRTTHALPIHTHTLLSHRLFGLHFSHFSFTCTQPTQPHNQNPTQSHHEFGWGRNPLGHKSIHYTVPAFHRVAVSQDAVQAQSLYALPRVLPSSHIQVPFSTRVSHVRSTLHTTPRSHDAAVQYRSECLAFSTTSTWLLTHANVPIPASLSLASNPQINSTKKVACNYSVEAPPSVHAGPNSYWRFQHWSPNPRPAARRTSITDSTYSVKP